MPRPPRFDDDAILDAALKVIDTKGPHGLTTEAVASEMGGHVGSIYYRFPTKDHLLAQLWMRAAGLGQAGIRTALALEDLEDAFEAAVLHYPRWARDDPASARLLAAYGREQVTPRWPSELDDALRTVNDDLAQAIERFTGRWYGAVTTARRRTVTFALLDLPSSAIRRFLLAQRLPPTSMDATILAAARAAVASTT